MLFSVVLFGGAALPAFAETEWRSVATASDADGAVAVEEGGAALIIQCAVSALDAAEKRIVGRLASLTLEDAVEAVRVPTHYRVDGRAPVSARMVEIGSVAGGFGIDGPVYELVSDAAEWLGVDLLELQVPTLRKRLRFDLSTGRDRVAKIANACGATWPARDTSSRRATIEETQTALRVHGFDPGRVDGVFDAATGAAIEAYQRYHGLLIDGAPSADVLAHLRATPASGLSRAGLEAIAAQIEKNWSVPITAKGAYHMVVPVRLVIDAGGAIASATAEPDFVAADRPMARRLAYSAEDAARTTGRLDGAALAEIGGGRDIVVNLRPPVRESYRKYARKLAQRIAIYAAIPENPDRDDGLVVRLYIDGSGQSIKVDALHGTGADSTSVRVALRYIDSMPRVPPVPIEGTPKLFVMDVTLFQRDPFVLDSWVAYPDWPLP